MPQIALAWLSSPPPHDRRHDIGPLAQHLKDVSGLPIPPLQRLKVLELFQSRVADVRAALKPGLIEASLPLPHAMRSIAQGLLDIHGMLASAMLKSLNDLEPENLADPRREIPDLCEGILRNLAEQQQIALFVATSAPNGLWTLVQQVVRQFRQSAGTETSGPEKILKQMLALAAVQPESFTARQLFFLTDYLNSYATAVEIRPQPTPPLENWYWLEESRDLPPVPIVRRPPPNRGTVLYFSCATLGRIAKQHLTQLTSGEPSEKLHLPDGETESNRETLARAQRYWSATPRRHSQRRPTHYRVQICAGFQRLWGNMRSDSSQVAVNDQSSITDWMVLNESPSGFALMHVAGAVAALVPGETLGLRSAPEDPWNIGLIRWVRSDNPEHLELGLEMISPSAAPVQIVRTSSDGAKFEPALLFPSVSGLERSETLMTMRGMVETGPFTLIRETDGKLQLTQCRMQHLALQTARVELLEFKRDFSPE